MASPPAARALEYWGYQYKRTWRGSMASGFLNPVLYLAALGVGLGSLVDESGSAQSTLGGVDYVAWLAPGLLAAAAMQSATTESTFPVMAGIKWVRTYHAQLATPLGITDVVLGHLGYIAARLVLSSTIFVGVMVAFGAVESWWVVLAMPAAVLTGMAFATPIAALAATVENDATFNYLFRFGIVPMFLFSGTFFPISQLPPVMRPIAYITPLWHGVDLCRSLALGDIELASTLVHVAYLGTLVVVGIALTCSAFTKRLVP